MDEDRLGRMEGKLDTLTEDMAQVKTDVAVVTAGLPTTEVRLTDHERRINLLEVHSATREEAKHDHERLIADQADMVSGIRTTARWAITTGVAALVGLATSLIALLNFLSQHP